MRMVEVFITHRPMIVCAVMDRVDQLPLPSLHWYAAFSGLSLFYVLMYGVTLPAGLLNSLWNDMWCIAVCTELIAEYEVW